MPVENTNVVRRMLEAWNQRDADAALGLMAEDAVEDWSRSIGPMHGVFDGHAEIRQHWMLFWDVFESIRLIPEEFIEAGDRVIVPHLVEARGRGGVTTRARGALVYELDAGLLVRSTIYQDRAEALAAVGA
ncbi:MAG TPA: nuclear transport factor 2 family protein [Solirubrobacteraceae bacterium]|jgi:ketosteroid isomerase-like protein|nr:nuclear transport factor 2 family protein [Solirubrobacteraceae bacterium]